MLVNDRAVEVGIEGWRTKTVDGGVEGVEEGWQGLRKVHVGVMCGNQRGCVGRTGELGQDEVRERESLGERMDMQVKNRDEEGRNEKPEHARLWGGTGAYGIPGDIWPRESSGVH